MVVEKSCYQSATVMRRRIRPKNFVLGLIAFASLVILNNFFYGLPVVQRPRFFQQNHQEVKIFPLGAPFMDVVYLPYMIGKDTICVNSLHVIIVHSAVGNFERRQNFRDTWASTDVLKPLQIKLVFIVGLARKFGIQSKLIVENEKHQDIIQGDFVDDYKNLTLKAVTGLRWVTEKCFNATTVIKLDDDVFLDIYKAMDDIVPLLYHNPRQLICSVHPVGIIIRSIDLAMYNKYKIPDVFFPGLRFYPMPFCYGFGVFMSGEVAHELFELSKSTPFYSLDDVLIYGILANKVEGLSWRSEPTLLSQDSYFTLHVFRHKPEHGGLVVGTAQSRDATIELWDLTKQIHKCNNNNISNKKGVPTYC